MSRRKRFSGIGLLALGVLSSLPQAQQLSASDSDREAEIPVQDVESRFP